jgi:putative sigma-54 modulation protein
MEIKMTTRHFKPQDTLRDYVHDAVLKLERYYDGIVRSDIILSFERSRNSLKVAEIHLTVYGTLLKAVAKNEEYHKAVDAAIAKLERQLMKYKTKLHKKGKSEVRKINAKE